MKNKFLSILILFFTNYFFVFSVYSKEEFSFNVTEIEILENGNKIVGSKRGEILTNDGIVIKADNFTYKKNENILNANGKVIIKDTVNNYSIYSDDITYNRNNEKIFTKGPTKSEIYIELENFNFSIENEILEGENILVSLNYNLPQNDKLYFENGKFDFKRKSFVANNIQINLAKDLVIIFSTINSLNGSI